MPRSTNPNPEIAELRMNPMPSLNNFSRPLNQYETATLYSPNSVTRSITPPTLRAARSRANDGAITLGDEGTPH